MTTDSRAWHGPRDFAASSAHPRAPRGVVLVTSSFPVSGDGSEAAGAFVADLAEELAGSVPLAIVAPGQRAAKEIWGPATVFRYEAPAKPLSTLKPWSPGDAMRIAKVMRSGRAATDQAMQAFPGAHLLALWALPCGAWAKSAARCHGVRYSLWTLGSDIWSYGRIPLVRSYLRRILSGAQRCWSDGLLLADDTARIAGREVGFLPSTRRTSLGREVPAGRGPSRDLLFIGRWHPNKGADLLLDALKLLSDEDWRLVGRVDIHGGGPLEELVRKGATDLQRSGRPVFLHGYIARKAAERAMASADHLLIPSRRESIPLVFSDAMRMGCPVITTPVGDLPQLLAEGCGILADAARPADFAVAIGKAIRAPANAFDYGMARAVERFDLARCAREILDAIHVDKADAR